MRVFFFITQLTNNICWIWKFLLLELSCILPCQQGEIVSNRRFRSVSSLAGSGPRGNLWTNWLLWAYHCQHLPFEMEKKNRCSSCGSRLDPSCDSKFCKACTSKYSSEASVPSTSEIRRDQVRGKAVSGPVSQGPGMSEESSRSSVSCCCFKWED